ncbi:MAG: hypothetical protein P1U42_02365 [Phycisphaerales bacterium]|nr:hypothetical protein [Phycisphaerales bacterium]
MITSPTRLSSLTLALFLLVFAGSSFLPDVDQIESKTDSMIHNQIEVDGNILTVQYLEIVTPSVDDTCDVLAETHNIEFSEPIVELGNARTADLSSGGRISVRAPMRDTETPVVRPYLLVDDIKSAVKSAQKAGAEIAIPPMKIPGQGTFSIYILGGIEHGLWQL